MFEYTHAIVFSQTDFSMDSHKKTVRVHVKAVRVHVKTVRVHVK